MKAQMSSNFQQFQKDIRVTEKQVRIGSEQILREIGQELADATLTQVPRESGTIADSFFMEFHSTGDGPTIEIGYGGNGDPQNPRTGLPASQYMLAVHEDLTVVHHTGKAKFLEDPLRELEGQYAYRVGQKLRRFLK